MRFAFLPFVILWSASGTAQYCSSSREFAVDNCTACPTIDHTHGDVKMAVCEEREDGIAYACVCLNIPDDTFSSVPFLAYYPHVEGNETRCASSWETAPHLFTTLNVVCACAQLYAVTHLIYIAVRSGQCLGKPPKCTKTSACAVLLAAALIFQQCIQIFWPLATTDIQISGAECSVSYTLFWVCFNICMYVGIMLFYSSICDVVFGGDDMARWRHCTNISFYTLTGVTVLLYTFARGGPLVGADPSWISAVGIMYVASVGITFLYWFMVVVIAHRRMHAAVRKHASETIKAPLVIKFESYCIAVCRYYYPAVAVIWCSLAVVGMRESCPAHSAVSPTLFWITEYQWSFFAAGVAPELFACFLEGEPVPTFARRLFRRRRQQSQSPGAKFKPVRKLPDLNFLVDRAS